jgi:hypothetical protein
MPRGPTFYEVQIDATPHQLIRLAHGHNVQLKHSQLFTGHKLHVLSKTAKRIERAHRKQTGVRIQLSEQELHHNMQYGSGSFLDALRNAGKWIKDKVIDSSFYQSNIKPIVRGLVNQGVDAVGALASSKNPALGGIARDAAKFAADKVGEATNAYGVRSSRRKYGGSLLVKEFEMARGTPLNPALPAQDMSKPNYTLGRQLGVLHGSGAGAGAVSVGSARHLVKGSQEAKAWAQRMREIKMAKRQSASGFLAPGY